MRERGRASERECVCWGVEGGYPDRKKRRSDGDTYENKAEDALDVH